MRILTWNVNGWRKIKTYQPFHALSTWPRILAHLQADVICLQETKLTRKQALEDRTMLLPEDGNWDSVWDFHPSRGYSGTVVYWKKELIGHPAKAEVGVTGRKGLATLSATTSAPMAPETIGGFAASLQDSLEDHAEDATIFQRLDEEGRAVVIDFGLFVLFNLYCPVMGTESRADYRHAFYAAINERSRKLLEQGREVIIVGDINIARQPIDHCDASDPVAHSAARDEYYLSSSARSWFNSFCQPLGPFHDVQREIFPDRLGMYTCWSQLINARPANYGTRIDYTLVSRGLREWVKGADIQPQVPGSDHCPVYVDFYDEREIDGAVVRFKDLLSNSTGPPALAASKWEELNRKDLKSFFAGAAAASCAGSQKSLAKRVGTMTTVYQPPPRSTTVTAAIRAPSADLQDDVPDEAILSSTSIKLLKSEESSHLSTGLSDRNKILVPTSSSPVADATKAAVSKAPSASKFGVKGLGKASAASATAMKKPKQKKLGSFFAVPSKVSPFPFPEGGGEASGSPSAVDGAGGEVKTSHSSHDVSPTKPDAGVSTKPSEEDEAVDWAYLYSLPDPDAPFTAPHTKKTAAWSSLFSAPPPPRCQVHREEATSYTVNKRDAKNNFGRKFWLCSRPVGPGYEKKWSDRKAEGEPGREYRCGFFVWNSDWEAEHRKRKASSTKDGDSGEALKIAAEERERKKGRVG